MAEKLAPEKRHSFVHNGNTVFEWDQTLDEVNMYIKRPMEVRPQQFHCVIRSNHLTFGIKGSPPFLDVGSGFCTLSRFD
ncbi:unnamed protein product [Linum tenue]|uniref:CS domain-containing protein n=1 Tax=Linum tenue TaxID=586396 RepID=A0AAV0HIH9_9ROSI|nr:unnamed protein product [Linum tenue]CAI0385017.1 unnamed protein product [Linum tenue]CAI0540709.1 unnamed protein product [Linum tenue]CAI0540710.1 unnamed protein product [Linum tenue]